jgi:hypothetical protein
MATTNNIDSVNANPNQSTQQYFNNYFSNVPTVSSDQDSAVLSYFEQYTQGNKTAAKTLASAVIYTSIAQNIDPMSILTQFTKLPANELNAYLTMFLNLNRVGTSYLGINNRPTANKYVKRSILA